MASHSRTPLKDISVPMVRGWGHDVHHRKSPCSPQEVCSRQQQQNATAVRWCAATLMLSVCYLCVVCVFSVLSVFMVSLVLYTVFDLIQLNCRDMESKQFFLSSPLPWFKFMILSFDCNQASCSVPCHVVSIYCCLLSTPFKSLFPET